MHQLAIKTTETTGTLYCVHLCYSRSNSCIELSNAVFGWRNLSE